MKYNRLMRAMMMFGSGSILLQAGGCVTFQTIVEIVQTGLLGVTAAGAVAILRNI